MYRETTETVVLAATTSAVAHSTSTRFFIPAGFETTITAFGLAGAETVSIHIESPLNTVQALYESGTAITLTPTKNSCQVKGPMRLRASKTATVGAAGVTAYL